MNRGLLIAPLRGRWARYFLVGIVVGAMLLFAPLVERDVGDCCTRRSSIWDALHGR